MLEQILDFISFFIIYKADENLSKGRKKKAMLLIILFVVFFLAMIGLFWLLDTLNLQEF
ncbi:MAG: hypothetical protein SOI44_00185 [Lactimicrobium sp.]|jgi:cell division septal protein FtsQ|uniref:hypothetical protein n=1 Tax=Lactimicrobium sp. TaxID=2563780 RepID=UPI002F34F80D